MAIRDRIRWFFGLEWPGQQPPAERAFDPWPFANIGGRLYPLNLQQTYAGSKQEDIDGTFGSFVRQAYLNNGLIFAVMDARRRLFVQARFKYRRIQNGRPGDLWGDATLRILERPWPGGTTGDLLGRTLQHSDLAGNAYIVRRPGNRLKVMRPDWTSIVLDAPAWELDAQVMGYRYTPGGPGSGAKPVILLPEQVAHFAPIADPQAAFRGVSWLTPLIRELQADSAANDHKLAFFEHGATPNLVVKRPESLTKEDFKEWVSMMEAGHAGVANAYKTLYLTNGADATVIGSDLKQLEFAITQGHGETRVAAAAGVPPIIVGLSEGLQAATYSNYGQARRAFGDLWAYPTWQNMARSLETVVPPPGGSELAVDDSDIPFLREDEKDRADIQATRAGTIQKYVTSGFTAESIIKAVVANDESLLEATPGLISVQQQPVAAATPAAPAEGTAPEPPPSTAPTNGKTPPAPPANGKTPPAVARDLELVFIRLGEPDYLFERYNPNQPRRPDGKWGFAGGGAGLNYSNLVEAGREGGFSVTTHGDVPEGGFMVSPYEGAEEKFNVATMTRGDVHSYRDRHRTLLSKPDHYLGGWREGDTVFLDVAVHTPTRTAAESLASAHHQLAFFDLTKGESVYLPQPAPA